ncbi:hypothetical protein CEXT_556691 [Caerostris extrusa]|uniref:mitogen-activated protein kinase kinase n=1 Tax=Caerostris extrusa TaxID=172846 RepID=A0AAV4SA99_CAEEX|nr:hypothetical protein CEXT_556691 [Caerostris extrusa]
MAVKGVRSTVDEKEQKQLLMDLEVVMKSNDCIYIVQFFWCNIQRGDCWICMELMDTSLDKFYKIVHEKLNQRIPESFLGKVTMATLKALNYLKEKLNIIHRDVKPSNILLDRRGNIKLCDFGISGQLVDSIAKPEMLVVVRIWLLKGLIQVEPEIEVSTGRFPYPKWNSVFEQLTQVVQGDPPQISPNENGNTFTLEFVNFVNTCLIKEEQHRPKYKKLLEHPFVLRSERETVNLTEYIGRVLDKGNMSS